MESAIRCRDLRKRYKTRNGSVDAVNGLDLDVGQGECFGLLGPNGARDPKEFPSQMSLLVKPQSADGSMAR